VVAVTFSTITGQAAQLAFLAVPAPAWGSAPQQLNAVAFYLVAARVAITQSVSISY
jgi:hypothetical protein